jgi:hypothetical protein
LSGLTLSAQVRYDTANTLAENNNNFLRRQQQQKRSSGENKIQENEIKLQIARI